jgi:hypothetical protein
VFGEAAIAALVSFLATILALRGNTWDSSRGKGVKGLTPWGWSLAALAAVSFGWTAWVAASRSSAERDVSYQASRDVIYASRFVYEMSWRLARGIESRPIERSLQDDLDSFGRACEKLREQMRLHYADLRVETREAWSALDRACATRPARDFYFPGMVAGIPDHRDLRGLTTEATRLLLLAAVFHRTLCEYTGPMERQAHCVDYDFVARTNEAIARNEQVGVMATKALDDRWFE